MTTASSQWYKKGMTILIMNTQRSGYDLDAVLVARNTHQDMDSIPCLALGIQCLAGNVIMYSKLLKLKDELGKKALRDPRTADELLVKKNYGRVMTILWKRYNYGMEEKIEEIEKTVKNDKQKEEEFSEKIDELNQETDSLMNELEKWQI